MKLLSADRWTVDGYDDTLKKWKFSDRRCYVDEADRESCVIGRAKYVDRKQHQKTFFLQSGEVVIKPL